jgi:hypothetical protein
MKILSDEKDLRRKQRVRKRGTGKRSILMLRAQMIMCKDKLLQEERGFYSLH